MSRHACINLIFLLLRHVMIDVRMLPKTLATSIPVDLHGNLQTDLRHAIRSIITLKFFLLGAYVSDSWEGQNYKCNSPRGLPAMFEDLRRLSLIWGLGPSECLHPLKVPKVPCSSFSFWISNVNNSQTTTLME